VGQYCEEVQRSLWHPYGSTDYIPSLELQYNDFTSVQGLLEAMRMALDQLSYDNLIFTLWNKVPFKLQKEMGEIKDWSFAPVVKSRSQRSRVGPLNW